MRQQLPTYFIIKSNPNNILWSKYIKWLNDYFGLAKKNDLIKGGPYDYYGYDGSANRNGVNFSDSVANFENNPELITLEEWYNIVYPSTNNLTYGGLIADFPIEVVEKMLEYQVIQGNKKDVSVFESRPNANYNLNGFNWSTTPEKLEFWLDVINHKNFKLFFDKYPRKEGKDKTVNDINFSITREQMGKIYDIACNTWKEKLKQITRDKFPLFKDVAEFDYNLVKSMFDAATEVQKPILYEIFPKYKKINFIPKGEWAWVRDNITEEWRCRCSAGDGTFYINQKTSGVRSSWRYVVPLNNRPF